MTLQEEKSILFNENGFLIYTRTQERYIKKNLPETYFLILKNEEKISFKEKLYMYLYNLKEIQKCETCNNKVRFNNMIVGFYKHCSHSCACGSPDRIKKLKEYNLERFGSISPFGNEKVKEKINDTFSKRTLLEKESIKEKIKRTYESKSKEDKIEIVNKRKRTSLERYGKEGYTQTDEFLEIFKENNREKYGFDYYMGSEEFKNKSKKSCIEKYGTDNPAKNELIKEKNKNTMNEKYGGGNSLHDPIVKEKFKNYLFDKSKKETLSKYPFLDIKNITKERLITIGCNKCKEDYEIGINLLYLRNKFNYEICTICNPIGINQISQGEKDLCEFIKSMNVTVLENDRNILNGMELDIYMENEKIAFEYNGLYFHSELYRDKNYHINKTKLCESKGIKLIHIYEDDWLYKKEIVKSRICNLLNLNKIKIFARKCEIKKIEKKIASDFYKENHIHGGTVSNLDENIALLFNGEIVSVMSFGHLRKSLGFKNNNESIELVRFCNKKYTTIIGAASKLFSTYKKENAKKEIISYADRSWSSKIDENIYEKLGFFYESETLPNYYYRWNKKT